MNEVNVHDLDACGDVFDWLAEASDGLSAAQAIELLEAARVAMGKLKAAIDLLETQALNSIEQPVLVGNVVYAKKPSIKDRPDQPRIAALVSKLATQHDDNGELPSTFEAAEAAVKLMSDLYVSPSLVPKVGGVRKLGLELSDVCREERTGWHLARTVVD